MNCSARFARIALGKPPTSSSLADDKRVGSFLLSTAPRDPGICQRALFQYLIRADFI
jgi:hypothetical protein